jgi:chromosome segregation ATPase
MRLDDMLDRCRRLEERAAALYRSYAASARAELPLHALWTALAREEEEHAHSIAVARSRLEATEGWRTRVEGWREALEEVEKRLAAAESLGGEATTARHLSAALDLEMTELEALRHVLLAASGQPEDDAPAAHAVRLAEAATRLSDDPHIRLQAALLRARARVEEGP